jgi:hypothetical protein
VPQPTTLPRSPWTIPLTSTNQWVCSLFNSGPAAPFMLSVIVWWFWS